MESLTELAKQEIEMLISTSHYNSTVDQLFDIIYVQQISQKTIRNKLIVKEYDRLYKKNIYTINSIYIQLAGIFNLSFDSVKKVVLSRESV